MTSQHGGEDREPATRSFPAHNAQGDYADFPRVSAKADPEAVGTYQEAGGPEPGPRRPRFESSNSSMIVALAAMFFVLVLVGAGTWIFLFSSSEGGQEDQTGVAAGAATEESSVENTSSAVRTSSSPITGAPATASASRSSAAPRPSSTPRSATPAPRSREERPTADMAEPVTPRASVTSAPRGIGTTTPETTAPRPASVPGEATPVNSAARGNNASGEYQRIWASGATSDDFAQVVHRQWLAEYRESGQANSTIQAYSPTTGKNYTMTCRDAGEYVHCTGGDNANVYIG